MQLSLDSCRHSRRHPKRFVNPHEVAMQEVQSQHMTMVLDTLGEGISKAGETPHTHPHGQVMAFYITR